MSDDDVKQAYWRRIRRLSFAAMLVSAGLTLILPLFMPALNAYRILRFPLGYFLLAQAAVVILAIVIYAFFGGQQKNDRIHNVTIQF